MSGNENNTDKAPAKINLMDIHFDNISMQDALDRVIEASQSDTARQFAFVNADCFNITYANLGYKQVLQQLDTVFADGIGVRLAAKILGFDVVDNVNGTDMLPLLCQSAEKQQIPVYFLGARPGIVDLMTINLLSTYTRLNVAGYHHGYFDDVDEIIGDINASGARILLVGFGAPAQELWISKHLHRLNIGVAIGVGGLFDFFSGRIDRAPVWMRRHGLEWVYRLIQEPGRMWKRYIAGNPLFMLRVYLWKYRRKK